MRMAIKTLVWLIILIGGAIAGLVVQNFALAHGANDLDAARFNGIILGTTASLATIWAQREERSSQEEVK